MQRLAFGNVRVDLFKDMRGLRCVRCEYAVVYLNIDDRRGLAEFEAAQGNPMIRKRGYF